MRTFLILSLIICGCAHGVSDPIDNQEPVKPPPQRHAPLPPEDSVQEPNLDGKNCKIVQTVYVDNCVMEVIKCTDGTMDIDTRCYGPPYVPVWEWLPDPPDRQNDKK